MNAIATAVKAYYDSQGWKYDYNEDENVFYMRMSLKVVDGCRVITDVQNDKTFITYSIFPIKIPVEKRLAMAEYLTRVNYGLIHGNFEMDFEDGEVRYKVTTCCGPIEMDLNSMETVIDCGFYMLDRYGEGILSILYGNVTPEQAIKNIEGKDK